MLLDDLATKYGTDKGIWGYLPHYAREMEHRRHEVKQVLEIGICGQRDIPNNVTGASLWMWNDYFPNAHIHGIDIDPKWMLQAARISSYVGDERDPEALRTIAAHGAPFDMIVDDAIHDPDVQLDALRTLLPFLTPDGLYVIEDVCPYKLPGNDITLMTSQVPAGYSCEVIKTHKPEVLIFVKREAAATDKATTPEPEAPVGSLGLVMIVKDEAHGIQATLDSFKPFIDRWTILDTGSTDGTQELIRQTMAGVPGELHEGPFVDFSTARNRALDLHGQSTVFTIMPDSDDRLAGAGLTYPRRSGLLSVYLRGQQEQGAQDAYLVNIRRGDMSYWLPLVMLTSAKRRYRGVVHEHLDYIASIRVPTVELRQDRNPKSHEATKARWSRDLALLTAAHLADPKDPRTLFYLAQTYECLSQPEDALRVYRRRIEVGGWAEETFETHLRIAKILQSTKRPWPEVQQAYLDAYLFDPRRAEPLFKIAEHWYGKDCHPLTNLFATRAAELPRPSVTLFVDEDVYKWKAADLVAISGFYSTDPAVKSRGRSAAERCVRARPGDERMRANWAFYAPSAKEMFAGYALKPIGFTPVAPYSANNPSVFYDEASGKLRCILRTTNYKIVNGQYLTPDDNVIYTRNYMLELDDDLDVTSATEMIDKTGIRRSTYPVHGFEDCRLFRHRGKLVFTATVCDFDIERASEGPREIVLGVLDDHHAIVAATPLRGAWSRHAQKNWMPISGDVVDPSAKLVYAAAPTDRQRAAVFDIVGPSPENPAKVFFTPTDATPGHGRLRGGSQLVRVPSGYLCIVHDVAWPGGNARMYLHRFVMFSSDFKIVGMTDPFYFERKGIEFCAGLTRWSSEHHGERLVASFGVEDRLARLGVFDLDAVLAKLRVDFQI